MSLFWLESCEFVTDRLHVGPWHSVEDHGDVDLAEIVAEILTARSSTALPEAWQGDFSVERANTWISERDKESPTLLVTERSEGRAIGLVIIHGVALEDLSVDLRIGYVIAEAEWGRGIATEVVGGLVEWASRQPSVESLTGGVAIANQASAQVLVKNGFELIVGGEEGEAIYQLRVRG